MQEMRGLAEPETDVVVLPEERHLVDAPSSDSIEYGAWFVVKKLALFLPAIFLFILAIQFMKAGAQAVGPQIQGQFPFANGVSTLGTGWLGAYFVLSGSPVAATAISLFGAGTHHEAPDVHDAVGEPAGRVVHRAADRIPLRDAEPEPLPRGIGRHRHPGAHDDGHRVPAGHVDRVRDHPRRVARRHALARLRQDGGDARQALGADRGLRVGAAPGVGAVPRGARRDPRLVQPARSRAPEPQEPERRSRSTRVG